MSIQNILCVGAGYVGGPSMAVIADQCPEITVRVVDINPERVAQWNSDTLPVYEPGLDAIVQRCRGRNLFFESPTPDHVNAADMVFVSVNTPTKSFGHGSGQAADLQYWESTARWLRPHLKRGAIVVEKSTVPVKTAEAIATILHYDRPEQDIAVLSNPEFLAEGTAIRDLEQPDRVLIGHGDSPADQAAAQALADVYAHWVPREQILFSSVWSSELAKLAANALLAQRITSMNTLTALCERTNADISQIADAVGHDKRIGPRFLQAGVGFGGSCFRKDILNLAYLCEQEGLNVEAAYWRSVVLLNDHQTDRFARMIVEKQFNSVAGKRVVIFGFAFKPGTNDTRDAPAIRVCRSLLEERAKLVITDPQALEHARQDLAGLAGGITFEPDPYRAAAGAHAIALVTEWPEFAALDYARIYAGMEKPAFLFDGRNLLDAAALHGLGFNVYPLGRRARTHL
jgi:UDPglucose 6-dehydrogenase